MPSIQYGRPVEPCQPAAAGCDARGRFQGNVLVVETRSARGGACIRKGQVSGSPGGEAGLKTRGHVRRQPAGPLAGRPASPVLAGLPDMGLSGRRSPGGEASDEEPLSLPPEESPGAAALLETRNLLRILVAVVVVAAL